MCRYHSSLIFDRCGHSIPFAAQHPQERVLFAMCVYHHAAVASRAMADIQEWQDQPLAACTVVDVAPDSSFVVEGPRHIPGTGMAYIDLLAGVCNGCRQHKYALDAEWMEALELLSIASDSKFNDMTADPSEDAVENQPEPLRQLSMDAREWSITLDDRRHEAFEAIGGDRPLLDIFRLHESVRWPLLRAFELSILYTFMIGHDLPKWTMLPTNWFHTQKHLANIEAFVEVVLGKGRRLLQHSFPDYIPLPPFKALPVFMSGQDDEEEEEGTETMGAIGMGEDVDSGIFRYEL